MTESVARESTSPRWYGAVWRSVLVVGSVSATLAMTAGVSRALPDADSGAGGALRGGGLVLAASLTFFTSAFLIRRAFTTVGVSVGESFVPTTAPRAFQVLARRIARSRYTAVAGALLIGLLLGWLGGRVAIGPDEGPTTVANTGTERDDGTGGTGPGDGAEGSGSDSTGGGGSESGDESSRGVGGADADERTTEGDGSSDARSSGDGGSGDDGQSDGDGGDDDDGDLLDDVIDGACDSIDGLEGDAGDPIGDTVDGLTDEACDAVDETTDTVDDVVDETTDTVDDVVDETTDTVDDVVDETTDTVDDGVDDGGDLLDGVLDSTTTTLTVPSLPGL